ncbi:hypothetical protein HIM_05074 [Hirsutella minnesotensis 3608]|uniref:DDB1- and CUL4-associated factor 13 n=1 Tax=Hirsutella minnesotensis 3608 TaxID=1043627 RepID=A0A0F7ZKT2_9HYPO|nr:hypothetical protein HIM_05074 [Hirsutella minnesotensis 3608]
MKVKALSRPVSAYQAAGSDVAKQPRNLDSALHPFERAREYQRALNAVKLERMHAAPFVGQLGRGHVDGVYSMAKDPNSLQHVASGSGDGVVKVWDLTDRDEAWHTTAHDNIVKGMDWTRDRKLLTVISVYDLERHTAAPEVLRWPTATDTITHVAFNYVETTVLASCSTDRSVVIYDLRTSTPVTKTVLSFATNRIAWSPMEAFNMATASEDHNVYLFDMRRFDRALNVLKDHVAAVMDVEYSPTGEELVTASWDRTIRLWNRDRGHSRDIYHTKRMQRVMAARWTPDSKYLLSGSDDGNIRVWRANASERQAVKSARHRQALEYNKALVDRFAHMPEVRRIKRHRHVPKVLKKAGEIKADEIKSIKRREENERKHSKKQFEKRKSEREKMVLAREK